MDFIGVLKSFESQHGRVRIGLHYFPEFLFCFSFLVALPCLFMSNYFETLYALFLFLCSRQVSLKGNNRYTFSFRFSDINP